MAQLQELLTLVDRPDVAVAPGRRRLRDGDGRIPSGMAIIVAVLWVATLAITFSLEPAADPDVPLSAVAVVTSMLFTYAILTTGIGMLMRQRWGLAASLGGGIVMLGGAGTCLAGGHSGGWLFAQLVAGALMTAVSWGALRAG